MGNAVNYKPCAHIWPGCYCATRNPWTPNCLIYSDDCLRVMCMLKWKNILLLCDFPPSMYICGILSHCFNIQQVKIINPTGFCLSMSTSYSDARLRKHIFEDWCASNRWTVYSSSNGNILSSWRIESFPCVLYSETLSSRNAKAPLSLLRSPSHVHSELMCLELDLQ